MSINTIILSKGEHLPEKMTEFLNEARFFNVKGKFASFSGAQATLESKEEKIDYLLLDLEHNSADLPLICPDQFGDLRLLLFSNKSVLMVDRAKDDVLSSLINFEMNRNTPLKSGYQSKSLSSWEEEPLWEDQERADNNVKYPADQTSLFVKSHNKIVRIPLDELLFIESQKDYLFFHTSEQKVKVLARMKYLATRLDPSRFIRIHRSYLVRIDRISTIESELVYLREVTKPLPIGPSYKSQLMDVLALV